MYHAPFVVFVKNYKNRMELHLGNSAHDKLVFFRKTFLLQKHFSYSRTSRTLALILLLPPVGSAKIFPHTKQIIFDDALPNITCSFLHFGHLILTNLLVDSISKTSVYLLKLYFL